MQTEVITLPADDADVLGTADSVLETAPEDGQYEIWFASDQVDGQISVLIGDQVIADNINAKVQTVSQIDMSQAPLMSIFVDGGARVIINYDETTAGTAIIAVRFKTSMDLLGEGIDLADISE